MPTLSKAALTQRLEHRQFQELFVEELGWDHARGDIRLVVDDVAARLESVAQKRGVTVYLHRSGGLPDRARRVKVERELWRVQPEHLIIFVDERSGAQVWQWVKHELGRTDRPRELAWSAGSPVEPLRQKLDGLQFTLEEEESGRIGPTGVSARLKRAFDADRVTRSFYTDFKAQHDALMAFLKALPEEVRSWYASVTLNRLMFVYFIQKKGFIDGDTDYLNKKLALSKTTLGKDRFFAEVLAPLFFRGFACPKAERTAAERALLGDLPYLNGGLFQQHQIERDHGDKIVLPDRAFETLFAFFDNWRWHLDERGTDPDASAPAAQTRASQGREINPDVLGYIFEKYINNKQMGAYYTKEDITEYICANTILPRLLTKVEQQVPVAFRGDDAIWRLLADDPDRYIWPSVRHGADLPLPEAIQAGVEDIDQRKGWDRPATLDLGLPTETWRETIHRRQRFQALRTQLAAGEIASGDAIVTANLDIARFVQDAIQAAPPEQLKAWWTALNSLTVLDPACGSGAFLFAALNLLEPLYTKVFEAMQTTVADAELAAAHGGTPVSKKTHLDAFRAILEEAERHANPAYFVLRQVALNNLYGVDIMEEAAEICKLRLFLKLVAQLDDAGQIEPLPDLDFNIRSGNSLVGFATRAELDETISGQLDFEGASDRIEEEAEIAATAFDRFRRLQEEAPLDAEQLRQAKENLRRRLLSVKHETDTWLATRYGIDPDNAKAFDAWCNDYKPFHWFTEFYGVVAHGGFDAVIGNPPFLEASEVDYSISGFSTTESRAVHGVFVERFVALVSEGGSVGVVLPMSVVSTQRMASVQEQLERGSVCIYSNFSWRPATLFDSVNRAITIALSLRDRPQLSFSTRYMRWNADSREHLVKRISPIPVPPGWTGSSVPKLSSDDELKLIERVKDSGRDLGLYLSGRSHPIYYKSTGGLYWKVFTTIPPKFVSNGKLSTSSRQQTIFVGDASHRSAVMAMLNSSTFWWWYTLTSNLRDLNPSDIRGFRVPERALSDVKLNELGSKLMEDLKSNSVMMTRQQRTTGTTQVQSFRVKHSKPIIDQVDDRVIELFGLSPEHADFIRSYDVGWRLSVFGGDEDEAEAA